MSNRTVASVASNGAVLALRDEARTHLAVAQQHLECSDRKSLEGALRELKHAQPLIQAAYDQRGRETS